MKSLQVIGWTCCYICALVLVLSISHAANAEVYLLDLGKTDTYTTADSFKFDHGAQYASAYLVTVGAGEVSSWDLLGYNADDNAWETIDSRKNVTNSDGRYYYFDNHNTAYQEYKLEFTDGTQSAGLQLYRVMQGQSAMPYFPKPTATTNFTTHSADYDPDKLFDGVLHANSRLIAKKIPSPTDPWIIDVNLGSAPPNLVGYLVGTATDLPERDPKVWTFAGSKGSDSPVVVASVYNAGIPARNTYQAFAFDQPGSYDSLKWTITNTYDVGRRPGDNDSQISELTLLEKVYIDRTNTNYPDVYENTWATSETVTAQPAKNAVNNNLGVPANKWATHSATPSLYIPLTQDSVITRYSLTSTGMEGNARDPKDWILWGCDEDNNRVAPLDSQTGVAFTGLQTKYFDFANTGAYSNYELQIVSNNGASGTFEMLNINLYETTDLYEVSRLPGMTVGTNMPVGGGSGTVGAFWTGYEPSKLIDGRSDTKAFIRLRSGSPAVDFKVDLEFEFAEDDAYVIKEYSVRLGNDAADRDPTKWDLYGFNETTGDFTDLLHSFDYLLPDQRYELYTFTLDNDQAYHKLALQIYDNKGSIDLQLSEVKFWAPMSSDSNVPEPATWGMLLMGLAGCLWLRKKAK